MEIDKRVKEDFAALLTQFSRLVLTVFQYKFN